MIVHNSFLASSPVVFSGFKTAVVNMREIYYAVIYMWDISKSGKPERWKNRCKFYGQGRLMDEYILEYLGKYYKDMDNTLELLGELLEDIRS
jgi:hypothetical protein